MKLSSMLVVLLLSISTAAAAQSSATDRRKADRPWTGNKPAAATALKGRASTTRVANGAEDTEWKEF